jgi:vacuolar-type H+-ATPase subunit I/STV1
LFKRDKELAQQLIIDQLRINEELKDKVNRELEFKVSERTRELSERTGELEDAKIKLQEQAEKISNMNRMLDLENYKLKSNVKEINIERGLLKALSFEEFVKTFPDENACYRFIEELKCYNNFAFYKCVNPKYTKGKDTFARKCTKCNYIETIKENTIFHNLKLPIEKAFQLIYLTILTEKEVSTYELADKLKLQQKTCWAFRQKILDKIKKEHISKKDLMEKGWIILIKE